jgi:2-polyprenyl-6-methoxyphenol hydroxylase-like FAD-dependent oxidoreductase
MPRIEVPVLIVGAGPVGLFASILLSRHGIENLIVERREGPHRAPQAHVVNPRTLEICRAFGLDMDRLKSLATPREDGFWVRWMTTLTGEELGHLPYERQGDENLEITPTPLLNLPQHLFEPVLLERVRGQDGTRVLYRTNWLEFENHDGSMISRAEDLAGGESLEIASKEVAYGASSTSAWMAPTSYKRSP